MANKLIFLLKKKVSSFCILLTFLQQKYQCIWKYTFATTYNEFVINKQNNALNNWALYCKS